MPGAPRPRANEPTPVPPIPCPMCRLDMEPYHMDLKLWACYLCGLTWNPFTKMARAIRGLTNVTAAERSP